MLYRDRLERALANAGKSRKGLAEDLGISIQAVGKVVRKGGKSNSFSAYNNAKAAAYLDVDADWLATGNGDIGSVRSVPSPRAAALATAFDRIPGKLEKDIAWATTLYFASGQVLPPSGEAEAPAPALGHLRPKQEPVSE